MSKVRSSGRAAVSRRRAPRRLSTLRSARGSKGISSVKQLRPDALAAARPGKPKTLKILDTEISGGKCQLNRYVGGRTVFVGGVFARPASLSCAGVPTHAGADGVVAVFEDGVVAVSEDGVHPVAGADANMVNPRVCPSADSFLRVGSGLWKGVMLVDGERMSSASVRMSCASIRMCCASLVDVERMSCKSISMPLPRCNMSALALDVRDSSCDTSLRSNEGEREELSALVDPLFAIGDPHTLH